MKTTKVKGFTLVELIVVMAIFGVIMAAALSLITPTSKVLLQSETYENGNAAVTSISSYLESMLSSAECIDFYNESKDEGAIAERFAKFHYEGILRKNSTPTAPSYGSGTVHVMKIDNTTDPNASHVYESIYSFSHNSSGEATVSLVSGPTEVVNKAYYNSYNFQIKAGVWDETTWANPVTLESKPSSKNTTFTIKAETNREINGKKYSFYTTMSTPLVSIYNHSLSQKCYYVLNVDGTDIVQIGADTSPRKDSALADVDGFNNTGHALDDYYLVYSYAPEIDTN